MREGISRHFVTLHVGPGTFLPVRSADTAGHVMHAETGAVSAETADALNAVKQRGGAIVAVGTTSLRLLESATDAEGKLAPFFGATNLFITPGYRFRFVDRLCDQFPSAALDPVHAGRRVLRPRPDAAGLRACGGAALSVLFLWRCLPAQPGASLRMTGKLSAFDALNGDADGRGPHRRDRDAARRRAHARLHAGRHRRHGQGHVPRGCGGDRRRHHPRQHLSSDAAARRRAHRARSAACTNSCIGTSRSSPIAAAIR